MRDLSPASRPKGLPEDSCESCRFCLGPKSLPFGTCCNPASEFRGGPVSWDGYCPNHTPKELADNAKRTRVNA